MSPAGGGGPRKRGLGVDSGPAGLVAGLPPKISRLNWGEERVYYRDEQGDLFSIPDRKAEPNAP
jgi:hypothetical protein